MQPGSASDEENDSAVRLWSTAFLPGRKSLDEGIFFTLALIKVFYNYYHEKIFKVILFRTKFSSFTNLLKKLLEIKENKKNKNEKKIRKNKMKEI